MELSGFDTRIERLYSTVSRPEKTIKVKSDQLRLIYKRHFIAAKILISWKNNCTSKYVNSDNGAIIPEIVNGIAKVYHMKGLFRSVVRKKISLDSAVLQQYAGKYSFTSEVTVTITREGENLYVQITGQPKFQIYAESKTKFFLIVVDAEIEFMKDDTG